MPILDLFAFVAVLVRGVTLALEALTVGGVIFAIAVADTPRVRSLRRWAALALIAVEILGASLNAAVLKATIGAGLSDLVGASFVNAALLVIVGALVVALNMAAPIGALLILAGSVLSSHAVARLDHRALLIALTATHHVASAAWLGGLPYLIREDTSARARAFSRLALASVPALVLAGIGLSWYYVGSAPAIYGTTYGLMILAKIAMLALLLILGGINFVSVRARLAALVGRLGEAEIGIGFTVILAAASLTSQPPAADVAAGERVSAAEIAHRFSPQAPRLTTPPLTALAHVPSLDSDSAAIEAPNESDHAWSEYNHHWAGIIVLGMGLMATLACWRATRWAKHWPLLLLGLAAFLFLRSDPENWPLGARGFWESFQVTEVAQHRVFVLLIIVFAIFEWGVRTGRWTSLRAAAVFPLASAAGAALLITHSHPLGDTRADFLAELDHTPIALLAVAAAWSRWLELRLPERLRRIPGGVWPACFVAIGALLLLYRET